MRFAVQDFAAQCIGVAVLAVAVAVAVVAAVAAVVAAAAAAAAAVEAVAAANGHGQTNGSVSKTTRENIPGQQLLVHLVGCSLAACSCAPYRTRGIAWERRQPQTCRE